MENLDQAEFLEAAPADSPSSSSEATGGVSTSTSAEEQRRLRREARQKRILASGAKRLNQITATFTGAPPPGAGSLTDTAGGSVPVPSTRHTLADPTTTSASQTVNGQRGSGQAGDKEENAFKHAPLSSRHQPSQQYEQVHAQLAALRQRSLNRANEEDDEDSLGQGRDPFVRQNEFFEQTFAQILRQQEKAAGQEQQQWHPPSPKSEEEVLRARWIAARWKVVHLFGMLALMLYVVYTEFFTRAGGVSAARRRFALLAVHPPEDRLPSERISIMTFFWYFGTIEAMLLSGRLLLQNPISEGPLPSTVAPFIVINQVVNLFSRYSLIWTTLVNDIVTTVFCFGLIVGIAVLCEGSGTQQR